MVVRVAVIDNPLGKFTILLDGPVIRRFSSGQTKLGVAPKSTTMVEALHWKGLCFPIRWFIHASSTVDQKSRCTSASLMLLTVAA
jgi:hypothetical protein